MEKRQPVLLLVILTTISFSMAMTIRVGFLLDLEDVYWNETGASSWADLLTQLENNSYSSAYTQPIAVTTFLSTNLTDATTLLSKVDVIAAGHSGSGQSSFNNSLWSSVVCPFVSMGGGIVFHSYVLYVTGSGESGLLECSPATYVSPVNDANDYCDGDVFITLDQGSANIFHNVPQNLTQDMLTEYLGYGTNLSEGAIPVATASSGLDCSTYPATPNPNTVVSYMTYGSGRSVHIGIGYSESAAFSEVQNVRTPGCPADVLLREAIAWAAAGPSSTSSTASATGTSSSTSSSTSTGNTVFSTSLTVFLLCFFCLIA